MPYDIKCCDNKCGASTWAENIVSLINDHAHDSGYFRCAACGGNGYVHKSFSLQEKGEVWDPHLFGVIPLGESGSTYQPYIFLCGYAPGDKPTDAWFCYYKDTRATGGTLKHGHGPGGPPVLALTQVAWLADELKARKLV